MERKDKGAGEVVVTAAGARQDQGGKAGVVGCKLRTGD